jgi:orotidine-5'-phosphate decarboxylase
VLAAWGLPDTIDGVARLCDAVIEGVDGQASVVKPQSAWFERFGSAGIQLLERVTSAFREAGVLVLLDAKRGDIGETNTGYADAWLSTASPSRVDAMTVSPYLGVAALSPLFGAAEANHAYVFVVAHSSNPEGRELQASTNLGGVVVADQVLDAVAAEPTGCVGAVIGATIADPHAAASRLGEGRLVLAPGVGAQGVDLTSAARRFRDRWVDVLPSASRSVLLAGNTTALRDRVRALQEEAAALG